MNKAVKAALLSCLVFPGSGQIYLKRYWRGFIMMLLEFSGLTILVAAATVTSLERLNIPQLLDKGADMQAISNIAATSTTNVFTDYWPISLMMVCCWIFSVMDAYRLGKS